jgi:hypothetical protein
MDTKECFACEVVKPLEDFYKSKRARDGHLGKCKMCYNLDYKNKYENDESYRENKQAANQAAVQKRREFVWQYLENHPCVDCGETDFRVLEFDHVRGKKVMGVTRAVRYSMDVLTTEIEKCEVRCANCHRKKTYVQLGWNTPVEPKG